MNNKILYTIVLFLIINNTIFAQKKSEKQLNIKSLKNFAFIPEGNANFGKEKFEVKAFFISKLEVSNEQYREFLDSLKQNKDTEKLNVAQIDTLQWYKVSNCLFSEESLYHKHPAYNHYPVVNISYEAAVLYCQWFTEKFNRNSKSSDIYYKFDLPSKQQWIRAARGDKNIEYTWGGPYLMGETYYCNFKYLSAENIHFNPQTGKYEIVDNYLSKIKAFDITAPVKSYIPNQYEIYNMCGNVAEMINEKGIAIGGSWNDTGYDVRVESVQNYEHALPFIGFRPVMTLVNYK